MISLTCRMTGSPLNKYIKRKSPLPFSDEGEADSSPADEMVGGVGLLNWERARRALLANLRAQTAEPGQVNLPAVSGKLFQMLVSAPRAYQPPPDGDLSACREREVH